MSDKKTGCVRIHIDEPTYGRIIDLTKAWGGLTPASMVAVIRLSVERAWKAEQRKATPSRVD